MRGHLHKCPWVGKMGVSGGGQEILTRSGRRSPLWRAVLRMMLPSLYSSTSVRLEAIRKVGSGEMLERLGHEKLTLPRSPPLHL